MNKELKKRILTSLFLIILLGLVFFYSYILIISLIIITTISWIEFQGLISRIITKKGFKFDVLKLTTKALSLLYLTFFSFLIFDAINYADTFLTIYLFLICIFSDIGGFIFGKIFKGKKLTKISPNKTISGSIGSFILSLFLVPFFFFYSNNLNLVDLIVIAIIVSFFCQLGDLFISYLKRKAKVKDTGDILPGHGGILDRIDGIIFAVPMGMLIIIILSNI
jgi:phosphatidate cytidylyltransferase